MGGSQSQERVIGIEEGPGADGGPQIIVNAWIDVHYMELHLLFFHFPFLLILLLALKRVKLIVFPCVHLIEHTYMFIYPGY